MQLNEPLLREFGFESANTRKMLERVPTESFSWKPHEKSMSLGEIAAHLAQLPLWLTFTIYDKELNLAAGDYSVKSPADSQSLLKQYDESLAKGIEALKSATDENLRTDWTLRMGDHVIFTMPRIAVVRNMVFNHMIHHRGQLSVYLRLLNIPVPGMYGPSYDDMNK